MCCLLALSHISIWGSQESKTATTFPAKMEDPNLVKLTVTVSNDQGSCVTGLTKEDFIVSSDKLPQPITYFSTKQDPASILFLIDMSGSMQTNNTKIWRHGFAVRAVKQLLETHDRKDEFSIVGFSNTPYLALGWTRDRAEVINALEKLGEIKPKGQTGLYNAIAFGLEQLNQAANQRRIVVLFSDGEENVSYTASGSVSRGKVLQMLRATTALFYAINIGTVGANGQKPLNVDAVGFLDDISRISGGKALHPIDVESAINAAKQVGMETLCHCTIGFMPNHLLADSDKFHKIKVELTKKFRTESKLKRLQVSHREGYYWSPVADRIEK